MDDFFEAIGEIARMIRAGSESTARTRRSISIMATFFLCSVGLVLITAWVLS